jgi:hypothetical protein
VNEVNPFFLVAALADVTAVVAHGYIGHRLILTRMTDEHLFSTRAFGGADATRRVLLVTWHSVTAAFVCSAVMMFLLAFGAATGGSGPLFVAAMHAGFLVVGLAVVGPRISASLRPIPVAFVTCMTTVSVMGWLGTR